jgi:hypothetical protein
VLPRDKDHTMLEIVGACSYDAEERRHTRNMRLEGQCMYMVSSLGPDQIVVKLPRIPRLNKSNSSAMEDLVVANDKLE